MSLNLFGLSEPFPKDKESGIRYTEELAVGLVFWTVLDSIVITIAVFLLSIGWLDVEHLFFILAIAIACPLIMILGFLRECLCYLSFGECLVIIKMKFVSFRKFLLGHKNKGKK